MPRFDVIAFDADDTLWHNERVFHSAHRQFAELLGHYHSPEWIRERLYETEVRNLPHFGYGIKGFALSMLETAVELTEGRITGRDVATILELAKSMLAAEVEVFAHAPETIARLGETYSLMVVTKGDLRDQEDKVTRSGLGRHFSHVEILSEKNPASYSRLLNRHDLHPDRFLMVGNSLRSDVLPVLEIGASAVYVPNELTWAHEAATAPLANSPGFFEIEHLGQLPDLLAGLESRPEDPSDRKDR